MSEVETEEEPSIEEILESIRQIISQDGEEGEEGGTAALEAAAESEPAAGKVDAPKEAAEDSEEVLDLTEKTETPEEAIEISMEEAEETPVPSDLDLSAMEEDLPPLPEEPPILSDVAADSATAAMARLLASNMFIERKEASRVSSVTLEDIARELMRPMVKSWLDQNLPKIINKMVAKEIERLSRRALLMDKDNKPN